MSAAARTSVAACCALILAGSAARAAAAQSLLDRSPNLGGAWTGASGTLHFHFMHRFQATDAPARKVLNSPTFLLGASLPHRLLLGARYATNSLVRSGYPNEWELFARWSALPESAARPLDVAVQGGWNQAAKSADGEVTAVVALDRLRLLGVGRAFSDGYHAGEARWAVGGGAALRLHEWVALAADAVTLLDRADAEDMAWSAGVQLQIPYSPHTLSLHASNANTTTLQGASRGLDDVLWGFEFTVPLTLRRYFGGGGRTAAAGAPSPASGAVDGAGGGRVAAEVGMTNRLTFAPDTVRIRVGEAVRWTNGSALPHTVTADPAKAARAGNVVLPTDAAPFDSGNMDPGATFTHTFTTPGTYRYVCLPHELAGMVGVVIVEAS